MTIEPPDSHCLNAAEGWLALGNPAEAGLELAQITPRWQFHPSVLEVRWQICAALKHWEMALETARTIIRIAPHKPNGWINQSFSLHELKRTREAWKHLLPVAGKFDTVSTIPYNLACYACQLGNLEEAGTWLGKAIGVAGKAEITRMALSDPDLQPIWGRIKTL